MLIPRTNGNVAAADYRSVQRVHAPAESGGVPRRVSGDGADGRQPVPGDTNGPGPRAHELPALSDAVWHQASPFSRHNTQG